MGHSWKESNSDYSLRTNRNLRLPTHSLGETLKQELKRGTNTLRRYGGSNPSGNVLRRVSELDPAQGIENASRPKPDKKYHLAHDVLKHTPFHKDHYKVSATREMPTIHSDRLQEVMRYGDGSKNAQRGPASGAPVNPVYTHQGDFNEKIAQAPRGSDSQRIHQTLREQATTNHHINNFHHQRYFN